MVLKFKYKMVMVFRRDLNLSPGKLSVQAGHAAVTCALESKKHNKYFKKWYKEGQKKVSVLCDDMEHMDFLKEMAIKRNIVAMEVTDAGLTEVTPGTKTCLGIGPGPEELIDEITGDLSLL
ncbi:MAG: peptidyl-tRNA hydrolase Pth2 [Thermoplasmata archaeon]